MKRITGFFLLFFYSFSLLQPYAYAAAQEKVVPSSFHLSQLRLPQELGVVEETQTFPNSKTTVLLVQDAHAIGDAQQSIFEIVQSLSKIHGIKLFALEGGSGKLNAAFLRAFPDPILLKKVFEERLATGEMSGAAAASVFTAPENVFLGVEDAKLYREGGDLYLESLEARTSWRKEWARLKEANEALKKKHYDPVLLNLDRLTEQFETSQDFSRLFEEFQKSFSIQARASYPHLDAVLKEFENEKNNQNAFLEEIDALSKKISSALSDRQEIAFFQQQTQAYRTQEISQSEYAAFLLELAAPQEIAVPMSLRARAGHYSLLNKMKAPVFLKELKAALHESKQALIKNKTQQEIDQESRRLALLSKIIHLQLNREEWEELKTEGVEKQLRGSSFYAFYQNAEARETALQKNLAQAMTRENVKVAVLVAGGFHTEGFKKAFEREQISYALLTPAIANIPEENKYEEFMRGNVSWKNYLDSDQNLHTAFMYAMRDRLSAPRPTLKAWRDQLIRTKDKNYAAFLEDSPNKKWQNRVQQFIQSLKTLKHQNRLNAANLNHLLAPANQGAHAVVQPTAVLPWIPETVNFRTEARITEQEVEKVVKELIARNYVAKDLFKKDGISLDPANYKRWTAIINRAVENHRPIERVKFALQNSIYKSVPENKRFSDDFNYYQFPAALLARTFNEAFLNGTAHENNTPSRPEARKKDWIKKNGLTNVARHTVVSFQMESGLPPNILEFIAKRHGEEIADQVAQTTLTGGLGALMHDLNEAWAANGADTVGLVPIFEEIKEHPKKAKNLGGYLREALTELYGPPSSHFSISLTITHRFRSAVYARNSKAAEILDKKIFVEAYDAKTPFYQGRLSYFSPYYLKNPALPDTEGNRVRFMDEVYPDDRLWRDIHMAIYQQAAQEIIKAMQAKGTVKKDILFVDNEVFVSLPKTLLPGAIKGHINHSVFLPTIYEPDEVSYELFGFPEWARAKIVKDGRISIVDYVALTYDFMMGVSLDEHTTVLGEKIFPNSIHKLEGYNEDGVRSSNGMLMEQWQAPALRQLMEQYKTKLNLEEASDRTFLEALRKSPLLDEFQKRFEFIKGVLVADLLVWLANKQNQPLWLEKTYEKFQGFTPTENVEMPFKAVALYTHAVMQALEENSDEKWEELKSSQWELFKEALMQDPIVSNVRRQVPYKGPDKWIENLERIFYEAFREAAATYSKQRFLEILFSISSAGVDQQKLGRLIENIRNYQNGNWSHELDSGFPAIKEAVLRDKEFEELREIMRKTTAIKRFKANKGRAILGGRIFDGTYDKNGTLIGGALYRFEKIKTLVTEMNLEDHFATIEGYNIREANIIFRGVAAAVMLSDEFLEAAATSHVKVVPNGGVVIMVWGGTGPEILTIMEGDKEIDIFARKISHDEVVRELESGKWRIVNGHLVRYADEKSDQQGGGRRPSALSLQAGLEWLYKTYQNPQLRRNLQFEGLATIPKVDMTEGQARAHILIWEKAIKKRQSQKRSFDKLPFDLAEAKKLFSLDAGAFEWRQNGNGAMTKSQPGIPGFIEEFRQWATWGAGEQRGQMARSALTHHSAQKNGKKSVGDIFSYLEGISTQTPLHAMVRKLAAQARRAKTSEDRVRINLQAIETADQYILFRVGQIFEQFLQTKDPELKKIIVSNPLVRKYISRYLSTHAHATRLSTTDTGVHAFRFDLAAGPILVILDVNAIAYRDPRDMGQRKAWADIHYIPEEVKNNSDELVLYQVFDWEHQEAPYGLYSNFDFQERGLRAGVPGIQFLGIQHKPEKIASILEEAAGRRKPSIRAPLQTFIEEVKRAADRGPKDLEEVLQQITTASTPEIYGEDVVPAIMAFVASLAPQLLESMKDWNPEVYKTLKTIIDENPEVFHQGQIHFYRPSRESAAVFSRTFGEKNVVIPIQFNSDPYSHEDGKSWSVVPGFGVNAHPLKLESNVLYEARDLITGAIYTEEGENSRYFGRNLSQQWNAGIPVFNLETGEKLWGFQILSFHRRHSDLAPHRSESRMVDFGLRKFFYAKNEGIEIRDKARGLDIPYQVYRLQRSVNGELKPLTLLQTKILNRLFDFYETLEKTPTPMEHYDLVSLTNKDGEDPALLTRMSLDSDGKYLLDYLPLNKISRVQIESIQSAFTAHYKQIRFKGSISTNEKPLIWNAWTWPKNGEVEILEFQHQMNRSLTPLSIASQFKTKTIRESLESQRSLTTPYVREIRGSVQEILRQLKQHYKNGDFEKRLFRHPVGNGHWTILGILEEAYKIKLALLIAQNSERRTVFAVERLIENNREADRGLQTEATQAILRRLNVKGALLTPPQKIEILEMAAQFMSFRPETRQAADEALFHLATQTPVTHEAWIAFEKAVSAHFVETIEVIEARSTDSYFPRLFAQSQTPDDLSDFYEAHPDYENTLDLTMKAIAQKTESEVEKYFTLNPKAELNFSFGLSLAGASTKVWERFATYIENLEKIKQRFPDKSIKGDFRVLIHATQRQDQTVRAFLQRLEATGLVKTIETDHLGAASVFIKRFLAENKNALVYGVSPQDFEMSTDEQLRFVQSQSEVPLESLLPVSAVVTNRLAADKFQVTAESLWKIPDLLPPGALAWSGNSLWVTSAAVKAIYEDYLQYASIAASA